MRLWNWFWSPMDFPRGLVLMVCISAVFDVLGWVLGVAVK